VLHSGVQPQAELASWGGCVACHCFCWAS